ncbi:putative eukaryotic translation initiation factor 3, gamma subunit [Aspergillus steynii IBT 23096]|uniref:tRNA (adenine(58)-N(1))-methyltransferase non-catalytic subunit TRM6 n=1 Tax=Aspergillus steynii IBT 23096 TaxID=1392250 RepID=A0A2I2GH13_9EURO|nr:putative eukaryotic translation initiation factor 3, gamma subunit [Aspergillus steynii IBT 23096]PLB52169.1 putative eukaryotic translation initiation factor 3, gamma subunit [Aspergillus steynii IBT 23096]
MHSYIRPHQHVALRLPSDLTKIVKVVPNTLIFLGKYGSFPSNQIIGRPFYLTFEILSAPGDGEGSSLRIIPAAEIHAESLITEGEGDAEADGDGGDEAEMNMDEIPVRTNRETLDDNSAQRMTLEEIEALKKESGGAGREIIAKLLESHSALDQKTAFSLAKYTLRKRKKYMKRFTVLPLDVSLLTNYMLYEKDATKTLELRDELLGLLGCWGNVHYGSDSSLDATLAPTKPNGRYLVIDDTGGLVVAAMAERMGILYPHDGEDEEEQASANEPLRPKTQEDAEANEAQSTANTASPQRPNRRSHMSARDNTITLVHANMQANLSLLKHFGYEQDNPDPTHPLFAHLKTVSWMQLLDPNADSLYSQEPPVVPDSELATLKPNKRNTYYRKRNRWMRVRSVVDEVREGGYDGLVVASLTDPDSLLKHAVPLLAGSAQVSVYSPTIEPLTNLMDLYSTPRKTAFLNKKQDLKQQQSSDQTQTNEFQELIEEFFLDPSLLLTPTLETSRVRHWQVLPGRTHPLMSGRGGAEGYVFHAVRVIPTQTAVHAAGNSGRKKRKITAPETPTATADSASGMDVDTK